MFYEINMSLITINNIVGEYIKRNPVLFIIYCLSIASMPMTEVILPHFYGKIINNLQEKKNIKGYIMPVIVMIVVVQLLVFTNDLLETILYPKMHEFIRRYCLNYIIDSATNDIQDMQIGKILAKMIRFAPMMYNYIEVWKGEIIPYIVIYIVVIVYLGTKDLYLALLIFVSAVIILYLTFLSMKTCVNVSQKRDMYYNQIYEEIDEVLRNLVSVLNNNNYTYENERIEKTEKEYKNYAMKSLLCSTKYKILFITIFVAILVMFAYRCVRLYTAKKLDNASVISIFIIMLFLFNTIIKHTGLFKELMFRYGTIMESLSFFVNSAGVQNKKQLVEGRPVSTPYCVMFNNVSYSYKDKKDILKNVNIAVECKENIAIIGRIGCGKSTILKLLMKYINPKQGEIYVNGVPYSSLTEEQVRQKIGYIQQSSILFNRTLMENIKYGKLNATDEDVYNLIKKLGLVDHFGRFPKGLDTVAGKNGSNLSGGEKQIIWILRILLQDPEIILLDEPTSAMDDNTKDTLLHLLLSMLKEKTVICVTHDNDILQHFHKVYEIKGGEAIQIEST